MNETNQYIAEGFSFSRPADAQLASIEKKKVAYLESRMDYTNPKEILKVYEKAIADRVFKTPIGLLYLKKIQDYLLENLIEQEDAISPIPLYVMYGDTLRDNVQPVQKRVKPIKKKRPKDMLPFSIIINIGLAICIIIMFVLTSSTDQPNYFNYKRVVTDEYSSWEQNLKQREERVREKERQLDIENN